MGGLKSFLGKPVREKYEAGRFQWMKGLARLPYCPAHYVMHTNDVSESVAFWWSYVFMSFVVGKPMFEYRGSDVAYLQLMWRLLRPGMNVLDIGAFHGLYSVIAAKRVAPAGQVRAFEPSLRDQRRLRLHIGMNRLSNVVIEPYAVSAATGTAEFYVVTRGFTTMNSLRPPATDDPVDRTVAPTISLDDYCKNREIRSVDLIKVDVEGAELGLFSGARAVLRDVRPLILCEVLDWVTRPWGYEAREIVQHLSEYGYEWFEVDDAGGLRVHLKQKAYPEVRNYLAIPEERRRVVESFVRP
jgi:FkbM family methyltransferase